jgi:hypothetical protein
MQGLLAELIQSLVNKLQKIIVIRLSSSQMLLVPEKRFSKSTPQSGSNEAPKTPAPGVATPTPQQNQGDKPASKPSEQQK